MGYATLAQVKQYLGITGTSEDALLTRLIDAASAAIDRYTGRRFTASTATKQVHRDHIAGDTFFLPDDLQSVTQVVTDEGDVLLPADFVPFYPPTRVLRVKASAQDWSIEYTADVTGQWGFSAAPPDDIVQVCVRLASWMYRSKDAQVFDVAGQEGVNALNTRLPRDIAQMLDPYVLLKAMPC
jgi:uncharacterized phiE125 gp8 family phage protein